MVPFPRPTKLFRFFPCVCKCGERKCGASTSNTNEYWHSIQNKREFKQTTQKETKNNLINYLIFVPCPSTVASSLWPKKKQFTIPFKNTDLPSQPRRNDSGPPPEAWQHDDHVSAATKNDKQKHRHSPVYTEQIHHEGVTSQLFLFLLLRVTMPVSFQLLVDFKKKRKEIKGSWSTCLH